MTGLDAMSTPRIVLFQPLNHIGLGHINRLSVIALALHQLDQKIQTPFVIEDAGHTLLDALGLPYLPLPSARAMTDTGAWATWSEEERYDLQLQVSRSILRAVAPQIVVFDCLPNAAFAEAVVGSDIPIVLCLREMRDMTGYLAHVHVLLKHVSLLVVPHPEGAFSLPEELAARSFFVGKIVRNETHRATKVRDPEQPHIVISGGGGGYPGTVDFYNLALKAIVDLRKYFPGLKAKLIAGPLFRDWDLLRPVDGVALIPFEPDSTATFAESDLVISQAGYNTVAELEQLGTKTILVPAERQWDDQFARADRVSRERKNFQVFRVTTPAQLGSIASKLLREQIPNTVMPKSEGAIKAAQLIYEKVK
jgi:predicted glycosyltransferase